jgi:hypothetical protein
VLTHEDIIREVRINAAHAIDFFHLARR